MDFFSVLVVFPAIILAVGVSRVLTGLAYLVADRSRVAWSWPVVAWGLFVIIASANQWWNFLVGWGSLPSTSTYWFYEFCFMLASPAILYFIAALMSQPLPTSGQIDLWDRFDRVRPWFFILASIHALLYLVDNYIVTRKMGTAFLTLMPTSQVVITVVIAALLGVGAFLRSRIYQRLLFPVVLILFIILYAFFA